MSQMAIALIILGVTILCFIFEPVPLVVSAVTASILYAFTGLIKMEDVFVSYNTNTIVLMIAMMIIGSSLFHSGISEVIGEKMSKFTGNSEKTVSYTHLDVYKRQGPQERPRFFKIQPGGQDPGGRPCHGGASNPDACFIQTPASGRDEGCGQKDKALVLQ